MPDISLFQPQVLRGVVEKLTTPQDLVMLNKLPQTAHPFPTVTWDIVTAARNLARPNVPNAEAHVVSRQTRSQQSASFIYLREKKVFEPTTLHWIRTPGDIAKVEAEKAVLREISDLNVRFDLFVEYCIWKMFSGTLSVDVPEGISVNVDYRLPTTHANASAGTAWASATPSSIVDDVRTWKRLVERDAGVAATEAYANEATLAKVFDAFAETGVATTFFGGTLLSDRMKDEYYKTGTLPGFMGLAWTTVEQTYVPHAGGSQTPFVADDRVILGNLSANRPVELMVGPSADDDAPSGYTGKYAKTWKEKDPSQRQYMLEYNFLPVATRPENWVYADVS